MRLLTTLCLAGALALSSTACDDHGHGFDNLPDCVVDHIGLGEPQSIAHCLIDFFDMNFADQAACVAWVTDNGGYEASREEACMLYFQGRGQ